MLKNRARKTASFCVTAIFVIAAISEIKNDNSMKEIFLFIWNHIEIILMILSAITLIGMWVYWKIEDHLEKLRVDEQIYVSVINTHTYALQYIQKHGGGMLPPETQMPFFTLQADPSKQKNEPNRNQ